jgi:D-3-phosphoglycerate dehydrogenase
VSDLVVVTDHPWPDLDIESAICEAAGYRLVDLHPAVDPAETAEAVRDAVGIMTCWAPVTAEVIEAAVDLKVVSRLGVGLDNIHVPTAHRLGVTVTRVPDYCMEEVADHTLALVLAWARGTTAQDRLVQQGRWEPNAVPVRRLSEQVVGIWGAGTIGRKAAHRFVALGCRVLVDDRHPESAPPGTTPVPLAELLATCHTPLNDETRGIVDAELLAAMKPGALFVNTSRGGLVDLEALLAALDHGTLGAAALDVLPDEPAIHPDLLGRPDVILTPHIAWASPTAMAELRRRTAEDLVRVLRGEEPRDPVPPTT